MKGVEWEKIRRNLLLIKDVDFKAILPALQQSGVLDKTDSEKLQAVSSNEDRMNKLCYLLRDKPHEVDAFESLLKALRIAGTAHETEIADKIESTETTSDPSVMSRANPKYSTDNVRTVLDKHFTEKPDVETPLSDFMQVLCDEKAFSGDCRWTNQELSDYIVKDHFLGAELMKRKKRTGNHTENFIYVKNVLKLEIPKPSASSNAVDPSDSHPDICPDVNIKALSPTELRGFLENESVDSKILDALEQDEICGEVFISLSKEDVEQLLPNATFGCKRKLSLMVERFKSVSKPETDAAEENLRLFNKDLKQGEFYTRGKLVDITCNVIGKKMSPIKNFHLLEDQSLHEKCEYIAVEVIQFAAACMNSRRNGTIYFGICSQACQGYRTGEVVGMTVSKDDLQLELRSAITRAFHKDHVKIVQNVMKPARFVPVHTNVGVDVEQKDNLYVIEYDFVSSSDILQEETITMNPKHFPCLRKKHKVISCTFSFSDEGLPKVLNFSEQRDFNTDKKEVISDREREEMTKDARETPNLSNRLHKLVTGGCKNLEDDLFPFLVIGPLAEEQEHSFHDDEISFVRYLHPEVIFDFNEKGSSSEIYNQLDLNENFRVLTADNFDFQKCTKDERQNLLETLADEKLCRWIFCNGDDPNDMKPLKALQWNKQRKCAFQSALNLHLDMFRKERILIVICLFSQNDEAIVEACCEILTHLPDQWILLAESERAIQTWKNVILPRNIVVEEDISDRCIVGLTWKQVSDCFKDLTSLDVDLGVCRIPHSIGPPIEVKEKTMKSWCDVDIVSITDPAWLDEDEDKIMEKAREVEEYFYRGGEVQWLNFHFKGQVVQRTIQRCLMEDVQGALRGDERKDDNKVTRSVYLYHQPGAGGTTVAKHVMWELRKEYRCCVVLDVTDQTCEQLEEIYLLDDEQPKPLLLFLDNPEEDKLSKLENLLEKVGSSIQKRYERASDIFCVLLICSRQASLCLKKYGPDLKYLKQELDSGELNLFRIQYKTLEIRHANPRFLISFNLLKENFDRQYLQQYVEEFLKQIEADHEIKIIKIVALLNKFDSKFRPIPVPCFDVILGRLQLIWHPSISQQPYLSRRIFWEAHLSQSFRVLLNMSSWGNQGLGKKTVRVCNKLMAEEILDNLLRIDKVTNFEIALQLLQSRVFEEDHIDVKKMQKIIRDILIVRQLNVNGKKGLFSELLTSIKDNEGVRKALDILEIFFSLTKDPYVAQQIARMNLEIKSYEDAKQYAEYATKLAPNNSFFWNTFGQLFLNQLIDRIEDKKSNVNSPFFSDEDVPQLMFLFQNCLHYFSQSQICAEQEMERGKKLNIAGFLDELRATEIFLRALGMCKCFQPANSLQNFLVNPDFNLLTCRFFKKADVTFLKSIASASNFRIQKLEEHLFSPQREENANANALEAHDRSENIRMLMNMQIKLDNFFGESQNCLPFGLSEQKQCEFRLRRATSKLPKSLNALLKSDQVIDTIESNLSLVHENVQCCSRGFSDLKTFLDFFTVILVKRKTTPPGISLADIQNISRELCFKYEYRYEKEKFDFVEKFFYFLLFNFPNEKCQLSVTAADDLTSAAENLKKVFQKKHFKTDGQRLFTARPLFCLANGVSSQFQHLIYVKDLKIANLNDVQKKPEIAKGLTKLSGTLQKDGAKIHYHILTRESRRVLLEIHVASPIRKRALWQKIVDFYLGFSFSGLQAFGVVPHDLHT